MICMCFKERNNGTNGKLGDGTHGLLPKWFQKSFLGYGNPNSSAYYILHKTIKPPNIADKLHTVNEEDNDIITASDYKAIIRDYY